MAAADAALQSDSAAKPPCDADASAFLTVRPAPPPPPAASIPAMAPNEGAAALHSDAQQLDRQRRSSQATCSRTEPEGPAVVPPSLTTPEQPPVLQQQQQRQQPPENPAPARPEPTANHQNQPADTMAAQNRVGTPPPRLSLPNPSTLAAASPSVAQPLPGGATSQPVRAGASPPWSAPAPPPPPQQLQLPTPPAEVRRRSRVAARLLRPLQPPTVHFPVLFHSGRCRTHTGAQQPPPSPCTRLSLLPRRSNDRRPTYYICEYRHHQPKIAAVIHMP